MPKSVLFVLSLAGLLVLTACDTVKSELGLSRRVPDEFAVVKRAPLEIPGNLAQVTTLPVPTPGAPRPQEQAPYQQAQQVLLGGLVQDQQTKSNVENELLARTGAAVSQNNIRAVVNREAEENIEDTRPVVKRLLNLGNEDSQKPAKVVDPVAEAKRIQAQRQAGQAVTSQGVVTRQD
jgi:hypothetical protein